MICGHFGAQPRAKGQDRRNLMLRCASADAKALRNIRASSSILFGPGSVCSGLRGAFASSPLEGQIVCPHPAPRDQQFHCYVSKACFICFYGRARGPQPAYGASPKSLRTRTDGKWIGTSRNQNTGGPYPGAQVGVCQCFCGRCGSACRVELGHTP